MATISEYTFASGIPAGLTETDTGGDLSAPVNGRALYDGGTGSWGDPALRRTTALTRSGVGAVLADVRLTNSGGFGPLLSLDAATTPTTTAGQALYFDDFTFRVLNGLDATPLGVGRRSIDYRLVVVPRAGGGFFHLVTGGATATNPAARLLWVEDAGTEASPYLHLAGRSAVFSLSRLRAHDTADFPTGMSTRWGAARAADDFTASNGTNVSGRTLPFGTNPLTWVVTGGTGVSVTSNRAVVTTNALALTQLGTPPRQVEMEFDWAGSGSVDLLFRAGAGATSGTADWWDFWYWSGSGAVNVEAPVGSGIGLRSTGAFAPTTGLNRMVVIDDGTAGFRCYLNDALCFTVTGADAAVNASATRAGFHCWDGTRAVEHFAAWPSTVTLPAALTAGITAPPAGQGAALTTDAFTAANGTTLTAYSGAWTVHSGTWEINTNRLRMTTAAANGNATRATGAAGADHEVRADITLPATTAAYPIDWYAGVVARRSASNTYVYARFLYQDNSPEVELWENNAGTQALIGYINLGAGVLAAGSTHNLRLACLGAEVAAYADGELVVQATTSVLTGTAAGVMVSDSNPHGQPAWDNVEIRATGAGDTTPPVISGVSATGVAQTTATIQWTTDEAADDYRVEYGLTTAYGSQQAGTLSLSTSHSVALSGLSASTLYHYRVLSRDAASNLATSGDFTFTTASPSGSPPIIAGIAATQITSTSFTAVWSTNIPANSQVEYGLTTAYGSSTTLSAPLVTSHSVLVSGLSPNTLYHWRARSDSG